MLVNGYGHWRRNESEGMSGSDPHMEDLRSFVREWEEELGEDRVSARDLFKIGEASGDFPHLMKSRTETGHLVSFSRMVLSRHLDAVIAGFYLRRMGTGSNSFYCLEKV